MKNKLRISIVIAGMCLSMFSAAVYASEEEGTVAYTYGITDENESISQEESEELPSESESNAEQPTEPTTEQPSESTSDKPAGEQTTKPTGQKTAWGKYNGVYYNDLLKPILNVQAKGMDVSHYQGKINWEAVSNSDIDFVIIRCGYGDDLKSQDDAYFAEYVKGCEKYNIPYGIYIYSYARTTKQAVSEANHVLRLIKETGAKPTYPIYLDFEDKSQNDLTPKQLGNIAETFFNKTIAAGYKAGVYANLNWWNNKLTDKRFVQWTKWVAQYNSACAYTKRYEIWQANTTATVPGVAGDADINFEFKRSCKSNGHINSQWVTTKKATIFKKGKAMRICSSCGKVTYKELAKLKAPGKLNKKKITLKPGKKYKKLKVKNLAKGDKVKSYKSSNKKIAKVSKKGVVTAGKKKGKATITVTLKSGKKLKLKVTVKK